MFGFKITPMTADEQLELVHRKISAAEQCVITYLNLHGLHVLEREPAMLKLHRLDLAHVVIDGMPLIALCRLAGIPATRNHRVTNLDLIWPLLSHAERQGWRVYYVGGTQEVVDRALSVISKRLPVLGIKAHHGFIETKCPDVVDDIVTFGSQLVFVGMGTGLQERWIQENLCNLPSVTIISVGALFEYLGGTVRTPPRWMGRAGLEWLFRLIENPRRFWRRYLVEPWSVAWMLASRVRVIT